MKKIILCMICLCVLSGCQDHKEPAVIPPVNGNKEEIEVKPELDLKEDVVEEEKKEDFIEETPPVTPEVGIPIVPEKNKKEDPKVVETPPVVNTPPVVEEVIETIMISVECHTINNNLDQLDPGYLPFVPSSGILLPVKTLEIEKGDTVLSILKKSGIKVVENAGYVSSIENIEASKCGNLSGWMYSVNGAFVNKSAAQKQVENGDVIKWMYTCDNGRDLTFN